MFEELVDKVRKDLYEEMGLAFAGKSSPDITPHKDSVDPLVESYMTSFMKTLLKEYRWAYSLDFLANYRERCECHCRQRMVVKNMIRSTVNAIISDCPKEMLCVVTDVKACSNGKVIVQLMSIHYDTATSIKCYIANLPKCIEKALLRIKHHGKHDSNRKE